MAELLSKERLQPALLDRLCDDEVQAAVEPRDKRVLSMRGLRHAVLRDLGWLLNTSALSSVQPLEGSPLAACSVLNYGLPGLAGQTLSGLDRAAMARRIRQAIWDFEPRIVRDSVRVVAMGSSSSHHVSFEIHGELWGQPLPEQLYLKTELDLELGELRLFDLAGGSGA